MDITLYKEKLEALAHELQARTKELKKSQSFGDDVDGFEEDADETEQRGDNLAVGEEFAERLERVEHALRKIETNTYGVCESCGKPIEEKLLAIDPESELCRECKQRERQE